MGVDAGLASWASAQLRITHLYASVGAITRRLRARAARFARAAPMATRLPKRALTTIPTLEHLTWNGGITAAVPRHPTYATTRRPRTAEEVRIEVWPIVTEDGVRIDIRPNEGISRILRQSINDDHVVDARVADRGGGDSQNVRASGAHRGQHERVADPQNEPPIAIPRALTVTRVCDGAKITIARPQASTTPPAMIETVEASAEFNAFCRRSTPG